MSQFYTGIGSRKTPEQWLKVMRSFAKSFEHLLIVRSGGAAGADVAFSNSVSNADVYLPFKSFNQHINQPGKGRLCIDSTTLPRYADAMKIAAEYHPAWERCGSFARACHTRNVFQVLGPTLDLPSLFVVCWTPHGSGAGGTGQAIRIARSQRIPVLDLGRCDAKGISPTDAYAFLMDYAAKQVGICV